MNAFFVPNALPMMGSKIRLTSLLVSFQMLAASHLPDPVTFVLPRTFFLLAKVVIGNGTQ